MSDGISDRFKQKRRVEEDSDWRERAETMDNRSKQDINRDLPNINFVPDWTKILTPDEAEKEFNGFIWKGCGWYFLADKTIMLVLPIGDKGRKFRFCYYENEMILYNFGWIVNASTRQDDRCM